MTSKNETTSAETNGVPEGWAGTSALYACNLIRGVSYKSGEAITTPESGYFPLLRANNIGDELNFEELYYVPEFRVSKEKLLRAGDIVVAMSSGSKKVVGKAASLRKTWDGTFGAFCSVLRPSVSLNMAFIGYFFKTRTYRETISAISAGVNINNLKREYFENLTIPIPPLPEQEHIVAKVEKLLERVNAARERLKKLPAMLKRFRQSVLHAAVTGRLTANFRLGSNIEGSVSDSFTSVQEKHRRVYRKQCELAITAKRKKPRMPVNIDEKLSLEYVDEYPGIPYEWIYIPLGFAADSGSNSIVDGPFGTSIDVKRDYIEQGVPVLRINNIKPFRFITDILRFVAEAKYTQLSRHNVLPDDVLMTKVGTIGDSCIFPPAYQKAMLSTTGSCRIRVCQELVTPKYVCIYLNSLKVFLNSIVSESVQPFLNMRIIKRLPLALPSLTEQHEIVKRVEELFKLADRIEEKIKAATERAEKLTQAILAKAFRGELVPTEAELARKEGRDYEPASALLERIKTEREKNRTGKKQKKPTK